MESYSPFKKIIETIEQLTEAQSNDYKPILNWEKHKPIDWEDLYNGIEINPDEITICPDGTFKYEGLKVLLYIRDNFRYNLFSFIDNNLPKFHISECRTIKEMKEAKRYISRYVVTNRRDGLFNIRINQQEKPDQQLSVCKNCLTRLNYNNYNDPFFPNKRNSIFKNFSIENFFSLYIGIQDIPPYTEKTAPINEYAKNWRKISRNYKDTKGWKCEDCGKSFAHENALLEVHHIDGQKSNNSPDNLKALCHICHSKQPYHGHMKRWTVLQNRTLNESSLQK